VLGALGEVVEIGQSDYPSNDRPQKFGKEFDDLTAKRNVLCELGGIREKLFVAAWQRSAILSVRMY